MLAGAVALLLAVAATPAMAADDPASAAFDRSIVATKKAMMGDPRSALASAEASRTLATRLADPRARTIAVATAQWLIGEALIGINAPGRAAPIIDEALAAVERVQPNTKLHGDLLRSKGALAAMNGRAQEALRSFQTAHRLFARAGERRNEAIALQDIGQIYRDAGDLPRVLRYYDQSLEVFSDDPLLRLSTHNNRAQVLREMHRYDAAIVEYGLALTAAKAIKSPLLEARILTNLAMAQVDAGNLAQAERAIAAATGLARRGDVQGWRPFVWGVTAKAAAARGDDARAAALLAQMFDDVDLSTTPMPFREFHQLAAQVYERLGEGDRALAHLKAYQRLDAEARALVASTSAQLAAAQFDFTNQNLRISRLKQGQLERDVAIARQRSLIFQGLLAAGLIVVGLLGFGLWQSRRSRLRLAKSNTALEKALAAKTEFLATTSHEIRTPLNGILGMTQVILADPRVAAETRERVEVVQGAGEAMKALVDDILDMAKIETGEIVIVRETTDLAAILDDAARLWSAQAELKGLTLSLDHGDAPDRIISDPGRLRQIVFNLMSNATKFTLAGGVQLAAAAETGPTGETLVITVRDSGIGIAPDQHELIFEPFRQVDGGKDRRFSGTGLGLSICRRLAIAMGGTIEVASAVDAGATFTVRLPLERVARPILEPARALAEVNMVVADKNALTQAVLRGVLTSHVARLETVGSASAVGAAIADGGLHHLLLDANLVEGADAVSDLRELIVAARQAGVRTTLLYAKDALDVAAVSRVAADLAIMKPIGAVGLIATLSECYAPAAPRDDVANLAA